VSRPHPALLRLAEGLIIAGVATAATALVARLAHADRVLLRLLEGGALLLAAGAYLAHLLSHRPTRRQLVLRSGLVTAFTLWAIVQLFPDWSAAATVNDGAIVLFIADLALVLSPWRLALD
jgi:hypothetical protein